MKKVIVMTAALIMGFAVTGFAQATAIARAEKQNTISIEPGYAGIVVNDGVDIQLVNGDADEITVTGDAKEIKKVYAEKESGVLVVGRYNGGSRKKVTLTVPARYVSYIAINGTSHVSSKEILNNKKMNIEINGECEVDVKSSGAIHVVSTGEFYFTEKRAVRAIK